MNMNDIPAPIRYALTGLVLLVIGYGAAKYFPGLNEQSLQQPSVVKDISTTSNSNSVKIKVLNQDTQEPIGGANVRMESKEGTDLDKTDNLGSFRVQIPNTDYVRVNVSKDGCTGWNQDLNLKSNPGRYKRIFLVCSVPNKKSTNNK
ncbi:MAG: hypothetical protein QNJ51_09770 [Calothrix sp. MO_167.B12]|nr:hypothetical protein [Calothrix sp. MO_167.B12]